MGSGVLKLILLALSLGEVGSSALEVDINAQGVTSSAGIMPFKFPRIVKTLRILTATAEGIFSGLINLLWTRDFGDRIELKPGDIAPDFSLAGSDGRCYGLRNFHGTHVVVLAWFPKAFTPG